MAGNNINSVFYAESYHPIQAGSIDGTDVVPHDNAVFRAHLCSNAGLYDPLADAKAIGDPYRTVFVGRLSRLTTEKTLHKAMCRYGRIKDLRLVRDIVTGASRGYAFIEYETERDMRRAYQEAHHSIIDDCEILVDYNRQRLMPGWIPRRLGGGLGGRKESGQLRFGGRERPFRAPLRPIPHEELKRLGIPPPPVGRYMPRFQVPSPPRRKRSSPGKEVFSEGTSSFEREDHRKGSIDNEVNSSRKSSMKEHYHGKNSGDRLDHYWKTKYKEKRGDHRRSSRDKEDSYEASIGESEERYQKQSHRGRGEHVPRGKNSIDREDCERSSSTEREEYRRRRKDDEVNSSIQRFMEEKPHRGKRLREGSEHHRNSMGGDHYRRSSMDRESQYDASMSEREDRHLKQGHRDKEERGHKRKRSSADWEEHSETSNFKEKEHRRAMDNESYSDRQRFADEKHYHSRSLKEKSGLSRKNL